MKIKVVGCPSKPEVVVDVPPSATFQNIFTKVEAASGAALNGYYTLHITDATGAAVMQAPLDDTLANMGLSGDATVLRLVPAGSASPRGKLSHKERMSAIYQKYDPTKIGGIDAMLAKFPGREEAVIKKLVEKYGPEPVPEPPAETPPTSAVAKVPPKKAPPAAALAVKNAPLPAAAAPQPRTAKERMVALYQKYDPAKVGAVDALLGKYAGKEEQIIAKMVEKYGPEPEVTIAAPHPTRPVPEESAERAPPPPPVAATPKPIDPAVRARVLQYCEKRAPANVSRVDEIVTKFGGNEEEVMAKLVAKYGPEESEEEEEEAAEEPPVETDASVPAVAVEEEKAASPVPPLSFAAQQKSQPPPPSKERYLPALTKLVSSMSDVLDTEQRRVFNSKWRSWIAGKRAEAALASGIFEGSGPFVANDEGTGAAALTVKSLEEYYTFTSGTNTNTPISATLARSLYQMTATARSTSQKRFDVAPDLARASLLVRDTPIVARTVSDATDAFRTTLETVTGRAEAAEKTLSSTQLMLQETSIALSDLRLYVTEVEKQAVVDQAALLRLGNVERDLGDALEREVQYQRDIAVLRQAQLHEEERGAKLKQDHAKLRKELADERRGLPSDMEVLVAQKDGTIASLQQELARVRTKARGAKEREDALHGTIGEMNDRLLQMETTKARRGASVSASPRGAASPMSTVSKRLTASYSPQHTQSCSAPLRYATQVAVRAEEDYEPVARPQRQPVEDASYTYLAEEDDPALDLEIQKRNHLPDRGGCPHCLIPLTAFMGDRYGTAEDASKVAFCFSCRRSFTGLDLARRDAKARSAKSALGSKSGLSQTR